MDEFAIDREDAMCAEEVVQLLRLLLAVVNRNGEKPYKNRARSARLRHRPAAASGGRLTAAVFSGPPAHLSLA